MSINNFIDILLSVLSYLTYQIQFSQSKYYVWNFPKVTTKPSAKPFSWHENKFYLRKSKSSFSYQWLCTWFGNLEMFYFFHFGWLLVGRWMCCNFPLLFLNDCHASLSHLPAITKADSLPCSASRVNRDHKQVFHRILQVTAVCSYSRWQFHAAWISNFYWLFSAAI